MRENNRKPIEKCRKKLPQFTTMNVIDGQAGLVIYSSLIFYSLTINNILNIIVLLILAGISIATLTGENGILTRANDAKEQTEIAEEREKVKLSATGARIINNGGEITEDNLEKELTKNIGEKDKDYTLYNEGQGFIVTYINTNRSYIIYTNGNIKEAVTREGIKVGDYIDYLPDENIPQYTTDELREAITGSNNNINSITQDLQYVRDGEGMTWQVLRIYADGSMDLIGSATNQTIYFQGANGYNNGVTVMNDICEALYSRGDIKARSVKVEDFEYWLTDKGKAVRDASTSYSGGPIYGHTQTYTSKKMFPNLYAQEIGANIDSGLNGLTEGIDKEKGNTIGLGISDEGIAIGSTQASTSLTVTETVWSVDINSTNFGEGYNSLKTTNTYWLASRYSSCGFLSASFGLYKAKSSNIYGDSIFFSNGASNSIYNNCLRPVVSLNSSIQIENCVGINSVDNMHKIIQY